MRTFVNGAGLRLQFSLETRHRTVQSIGLAPNIGFREGRIETEQLREKRLTCTFVNRPPYLRRGIRQAGDGLGKQRVIFSHFAFRAFPGRPVNWRPLRRFCVADHHTIHMATQTDSASKTKNVS